MMQTNYNPDVLSCLANLSNDEVFTPPNLVNDMLDLLPASLWRDPKTKFLDPVSKSGVFLREIAKRLDHGLEAKIPDRQKRINHIFSQQLYGFAITELTALLSRRSVYCSKTANGHYSICDTFDHEQGNIHYERKQHTWQGGKCTFCGVSQRTPYNREDAFETYAYNFIHTDTPEKFFKMKFDVIIGNPPYQLTVGIEKENYSIPLYHLFVEQAKKLNPKYLTMIVPSRWFAGGRGLDDFRKEMLNDMRLRVIYDFPEAIDCFPGTQIKGGVCYFLWDRDNKGLCKVTTSLNGNVSSSLERPLLENGVDTFIRFNKSIPILHKVKNNSNQFLDEIVSPQTPFGFVTSFKGYKKSEKNTVKIYISGGHNYVPLDSIKKGQSLINDYKVFVPKAGSGSDKFPHTILGQPFIGEPNSISNQTYLAIGPLNSEEECENFIKYFSTKFFRFMVMLKKNTQDAMRGTYSLVPFLNLSEVWTDEKLYKKYGLTEDEIAFIESMIRPMDLTTNESGDE
jgi:site-specific DNA-methyltransferase (adenine-specific)